MVQLSHELQMSSALPASVDSGMTGGSLPAAQLSHNLQVSSALLVSASSGVTCGSYKRFSRIMSIRRVTVSSSFPGLTDSGESWHYGEISSF